MSGSRASVETPLSRRRRSSSRIDGGAAPASAGLGSGSGSEVGLGSGLGLGVGLGVELGLGLGSGLGFEDGRASAGCTRSESWQPRQRGAVGVTMATLQRRAVASKACSRRPRSCTPSHRVAHARRLKLYRQRRAARSSLVSLTWLASGLGLGLGVGVGAGLGLGVGVRLE